MPPRAQRAVIVFARLPVEGKVKTRLASSLGSASAATAFYKACAEHIFQQAARCAADRRVVYHADAGEHAAVQRWVSSCGLELETAPQSEVPDLGERMRAALAAELQLAQQVVLVGSDIPGIDPTILESAFRALDSHQLVLGPACDGGFYLIGGTAAPSGFLQGLTWSTDHVLDDTTARARTLGLSVGPATLLPQLRDIDTAQDLQEWEAESDDHPLRAVAITALPAAVGKT